MRYYVHFYKVNNLSPDERNAKRRNQRGIWITAGVFSAGSSRMAISAARREDGLEGIKMRAREVAA